MRKHIKNQFTTLQVSNSKRNVLRKKNMFGLFKSKKKEIIKKYLEEGAQLLDVRTASEFNSNHIKGSKNIPVQVIDQNMKSLDKEKPVIVYCAMGGRSNMAANKLKANGFKVINAGGIGTMRKHLKP
ncbi:phage shock protein E [Nonlabens ulvanivorans]|uniref:Phage shock protein E n=2 Tax=Nonlabens ulvanivorans TaxID=906888 RepID=A0ABX5E2R7_NONUL|nr:phage shock protein E [Nonlabens ulvanivorans]